MKILHQTTHPPIIVSTPIVPTSIIVSPPIIFSSSIISTPIIVSTLIMRTINLAHVETQAGYFSRSGERPDLPDCHELLCHIRSLEAKVDCYKALVVECNEEYGSLSGM